MTPTKILVGQITLVFAIVIAGLWFATQWCAGELEYQPRLGTPWFAILDTPFYYPWRLFQWWYAYDAYAPRLFNEAGGIAASSGIMGCAVAIAGSLWRARQNQHVDRGKTIRRAFAHVVWRSALSLSVPSSRRRRSFCFVICSI